MGSFDRYDYLRAGPGSGWGWIVAYGLLLAVIGLLALLQPIATSFATGVFLAFVLISGGVLGIAAGIMERGWRSRWLDIAVGLLSLLFGAIVIWNPFLGAFSLVWAMGLWLMACGGMEIASGLTPALHRGWLIVLGVIDILLGAYLVLAGPADAMLILALFVGLSFLVRGVFLGVLGIRLRPARR
ncbi:HdeD family acid-resistance protein [Sphingomonas oryzagri]